MIEIRQTTTLIEIRDFIATHDGEAPPWGRSGDAVEALYRLLCRHHEDEGFWADLEGLVRRLDDRRFDPSPLRGAELLGDDAIERLVRELRQSLGATDEAPPPSWQQWLARPAGAAALAAFLLLGTATACDDGGEDPEVEELCASAEGQGLEGDDGLVYCELLDIVDLAEISAMERTYLLECLPTLDAAYRAQLLDEFETLTDEQLASRLSDMAWSPPCYEDAH